MKKILTIGAALAVAATVTATALAETPAPPTPVPFPAAKAGPVFVAAQTITAGGAMSSWFAPGNTVVFRAYALDTKTKKLVAKKDVKFFYVAIPSQPNVKLTYNPTAPGASQAMPWIGSWTVPASFANGSVPFKVLIKLSSKRTGQFVQIPVATSTLNVSAAAPPVYAPVAGAVTNAGGLAGSGKFALSLYVDSINGTAPAGTQSRPIGCTQTNVYKRGERVVIRAWGNDLATGDVLSTDNVKEAHFSIAGQPDVTLGWGGHGAAGAKVWFWANFWIVPADFPLGETAVHVVFTTLDGKTGSYDYPITIIP